MEDPGGHEGQEEEMLNYINTSSHKVNLKAALDYHSVREPDMELMSSEGRKLYGHRSVMSHRSPVLSLSMSNVKENYFLTFKIF